MKNIFQKTTTTTSMAVKVFISSHFVNITLGREISTEAATETGFQNICSFFPGEIILQFSRRVYLFVEQTCFFPEGFICYSNRHEFSRRVFSMKVYMFVEQRPYYLIEHIILNFPETLISIFEHKRIFQEFHFSQIFIFQETLSSPRTHYFPGDPI